MTAEDAQGGAERPGLRRAPPPVPGHRSSTLETTQGQIHGFFSHPHSNAA